MKIGRNDKCPCNSGKKFKQCHIHLDEQIRSIPNNKYANMSLGIIFSNDAKKKEAK